MNYLAQVQAGVDFIEARLDRDIDLADVARAAGMSRWHFQRIFRGMTGETLKTYIRSRRMASALDRLLGTDDRILDIALDAGFETQESFTRAFKKAFGMTPNAFRKLGDGSLFLRKLQVDRDYLVHLQEQPSLSPELYDQQPLRLVGLRTQFFGPDSDKNNLGALLPALWDALLPRLDEIPKRVPGVCYGLVEKTGGDSELLQYHAVAESGATGHLPQGMVGTELPAGRYARFTHRGAPERLDQTVSYIYGTWLVQSGMRHTYGADLEVYGPQWRAGSEASVMYYAIPVTDA